MELTYSRYLKLDKILEAQVPLSEGEHDEMLFIIIHQSYELWFKQLLHDTAKFRSEIQTAQVYPMFSSLNRMLRIIKMMVSKIDILETMTPLSFMSFRDRLAQASGFQSWQFRMVEFLLGYKDQKVCETFMDEEKRPLLFQELREKTLYDELLNLLHVHYKYEVPEDILQRDYSKVHERDERLVLLFEKVYHQDDSLAQLCERLVDIDEGFQEFRYRHVKMVERTIGNKPGTGGSRGVDYLRSKLFQPAFPELWEVRSLF